jgi:NAD(P)-binding Rossmann-like domain
MGGLLGQRAVVVGAGIGGLSMAGALAKHFEHVEIFERDRLTASAVSRSGTPQDRHLHVLLAGGLQALDEVFAGFESDLGRAGAVCVKVARDFQYERADVGVLPQRDFGMSLLCASRPLIELVLRVSGFRPPHSRGSIYQINTFPHSVGRFATCSKASRMVRNWH